MLLRIKFIILFLLFCINLCFALEIDTKIPYRIYIGKDKNIDWIDIGREGYIATNGDYIITFNDPTPIYEIYEGKDNAIIVKERSVWKLYKTENIFRYYLERILLVTRKTFDKQFLTEDMKLVYKRK